MLDTKLPLNANQTLVDILHWRAAHQPDKIAYTFLADGESQAQHLTYGELDTRARSIAGRLQQLGAAGQRVLIVYPSGLEYICSFFGGLYANAVNVPAYPPGHHAVHDRYLQRLHAIAHDARPLVVLTTRPIADGILPMLPQLPDLQSLRWLVVDEVSSGDAGEWRDSGRKASDLAFLQYTSGSTSTPKGVMVSHGNLMYNSEMYKSGFGLNESTVVINWMPLFHDFGLIGNILQALYLGVPCIFMAPAAFMQKPLRWLQAISTYRGTMSAAPNFAYELCIRKIAEEQRKALDLSCWEVAINAAEPVRASTLDRFAAAFAPCGFRLASLVPAYGLAEATVMVSGGKRLYPGTCFSLVSSELADHGQVVESSAGEPDAKRVVGCGHTVLEQQIVIADPQTGVTCPADRVGEIWVSGPHVAKGYWERPEETAQAFQVYLADSGAGPFLRTGDQGFMRAGNLYITGRHKDLIIIRGSNHYPQDIEQTVERAHPVLRPGNGAAFALEVAGEERLCIAQEVDRGREDSAADLQEVIQAVREAVSEAHGLDVHAIVLLKTGSICKTTSGKIQRRACRAAFVRDELHALAAWREGAAAGAPRQDGAGNGARPDAPPRPSRQRSRSLSAIQEWLLTRLAEVLRLPPGEMRVQDRFARHGLHSLAAVNLTGELANWLGRPLPATLFYEHPTVELLARHLAGEGEAPRPSQDQGPGGEPTEPVAIIGMMCRFPGARDPESFWQLLREGRDAISEVPPERWDVDAFYDLDPDANGKMYTRHGGFLSDVAQFDPAVFGISPQEARMLDPQQRLLLEVSWEALERAGQVPGRLAGSQTGVFVGIGSHDYKTLAGSMMGSDPYVGTGTLASVAAGRISYVLGLAGPALAVDTACSSSLVAIYLACQSLRTGQCGMALAGGVQLMLVPEPTSYLCRIRALAPDGRCKAFDAGANGYVRGEGCGMVVLKRLSDALRERDPILAVIRSSVVNHDGRSNGLTAPNPLAQQALLRHALAEARLGPEEVDYVEAHGTGTALGDPMEVRALAAVLGAGRSMEHSLAIGSVKTNIGHLESAAGVAGLIKAVLALQHAEIPPHLHLKENNPHIAWEELAVRIPTQRTPWPARGRPRIAGVSSFGISGTNAHVLLEEAPAKGAGAESRAAPAGVPAGLPLLVSGEDAFALREQAARLAEHVELRSELSLLDVAYTLATRRTHFDQRLCLPVATDSKGVVAALRSHAEGGHPAGLLVSPAGHRAGRVAVLFTGQGSQRAGMGQELYQSFPIFRAALDEVFDEMDRHLERPLRVVMFGPEGSQEAELLNQTAYTQPALFALSVALFRQWEHLGLQADSLLGHSIGELAAVHVAGMLSLPDACALVAARGRLMQAMRPGAMAAIRASEQEVAPLLLGKEDRVSLAGLNEPGQIVLSGEERWVEGIAAHFERMGRKVSRLQVSHAFHSPHMDGMLQELGQVAQGLQWQEPRIAVVSNVSGKRASARELADPAYWMRQAREAVRFAPGVRTLWQEGVTTFVECGPQGLLCAMAAACLEPGEVGAFVPSLRRGMGEAETLRAALGAVHVAGVELDWEAVFAGLPAQQVALPTYAFQRQRYWLTAPEEPEPDNGSRAQEPELLRRVHRAPPHQRQEVLIEVVRDQVAGVLGRAPAELDLDRPLQQMGMDSLMAVSLSKTLGAQLGRSLSSTLSFNHPTIRALAGHLLKALSTEAPGPAPGRGGTEPASTGAIAVIGMMCRFPGARDPAAFWRLLRDGTDAVTEVPRDRWDAAAYYDPAPGATGKMYTRAAGFLAEIDSFDAAFFGISPREALSMDPQQRLLLEVSWEALEQAGQAPERLMGSATGVFVGLTTHDYEQQLRPLLADDLYAGTGNMASVAAGRLSYSLGLHGPTLAVDTACSSSLVAVHLACQSLRAGESDLALAGGVNVILSPEVMVNLCQLKALSPSGRSKTFDHSADGYGRGEGCGMVVLKRLEDAQRDRDHILGVLRSSAMNHDGRSNGLTAPNGAAQEMLLRRSLAQARLRPEQIGYLEAHGTGTALGDPIEVRAAAAVLGTGRPADQPLLIGSVKANIGHLEAAAGMASLIKVLLALQHDRIPPQIHITEKNHHIPWAELPVLIPQQGIAWPRGSQRRVAGISAFGFSGTNAHLIVEEAPARPVSEAPESAGICLLPLSAASPEALRALAQAYKTWLTEPEEDSAEADVSLADLGHTAGCRRSHLQFRLAVTGRSRAELSERLTRFLSAGGPPAKAAARRPRLAYVFSGQGSQWLGMGRQLLKWEPVFRQKLEQCDALLRRAAGWSLLAELSAEGETARLERTEIVQPLLFALQVGLAAVLQHWGVDPDAVVGHSVGEVAAACVAGALSLEDAVRVVALRGRVMQRAQGQGRMATIELPPGEVERRLAGQGGGVVVAAINSPTATVVSGTQAAVERLTQALQREGVQTRFLEGPYAFHSPQMEPFQAELALGLRDLTPRSATIPIFSTVTGQESAGERLDAAYFARNLREPVRFSAAIDRLIQSGHTTFLELGPHPVLARAVSQCLTHLGKEGAVLASLRRNLDEPATLLGALGSLYERGLPVLWDNVYPQGRHCPSLPTYPWQRQRFWIERQPPSTADLPPVRRDDRYDVEWQAAALPTSAPVPAAPSAVWIILADQGGVGEALARRLRGHGQRCLVVSAGSRSSQRGAEHFSVDPADEAELRRCFTEDRLGAGGVCRGVIHLWSLDAPPEAELTVAGLTRAQRLGVCSLPVLVRAALGAPGEIPPRLWLVTRCAQPAAAPGGPLAVAQAPLWGMGRVLSLEHPELWGGLVDLDPATTADADAVVLMAELWTSDREDQVAYRRGQRLVPRLVHRPGDAAPVERLRLRPDRTYLITGGLGALALTTARWLVERGARHLVLTGRSGLPEREAWAASSSDPDLGPKLAVLQTLEARGATVRVVKTDVSDSTQMGALFAELSRTAPALAGIIHAAGTLAPQSLATAEQGTIDSVLRPKVAGAFILHQLTQRMELEFLVFYSSIAAVWGNAGAGSYAAANHFLDALAHHRRSLGLPALSVGWGPWSGAGMASGGEREFEKMGLCRIQPAQGTAALESLLQTAATHAVCCSVDWRLFKPLLEARRQRPLLERISVSASAPAGQKGLGSWLPLLEGTSGEERLQTLSKLLAELVAQVLGSIDPTALDPRQGFFQMGMDSLTSVQLKMLLEQNLACSLPSTLALEHPSITALAEHLFREVLPAETTPPPAGALVAEAERPQYESGVPIEQCSEDELLGMLQEELARLASGVK